MQEFSILSLSRLDVTARQVWPTRRGGEGQQAGRTSAVRANRPGGHIKSGRWQGGIQRGGRASRRERGGGKSVTYFYLVKDNKKSDSSDSS